jgi:hypothetical protein
VMGNNSATVIVFLKIKCFPLNAYETGSHCPISLKENGIYREDSSVIGDMECVRDSGLSLVRIGTSGRCC